MRNWGVFVPTQLINFALVPPHLRFLVVSVVSLFWSEYPLCYRSLQLIFLFLDTYLSAVNAAQQAEPMVIPIGEVKLD